MKNKKTTRPTSLMGYSHHEHVSIKPKFIIKDWAGNTPTFNLDSTPSFIDFDAAEDFLTGFLGDDYETDRGEYYICEAENE
jgi:hypothetical protein